MARRLWLIGLILFLAVPVGAAAPPAPPLYQQVAGGEETVEAGPKTTLNRLALEKGLRWPVVARHNAMKKPYKLKAGMEVKINNTHIVPQELKDGLVINLPELNLYHIQNGIYQRRYALAVGKRTWPTPTGSYKIQDKRKNPIWNVPPSIQEEMEEMGQEVVEKVPPGPKNPLGKFYMATSASGVGIHATNRPWSVGSFVSHGCIRMLPDEIENLFPQVPVGTPVKIIYRPVKLALTPQGRVYLEAHPNIYQWEFNGPEYVKDMAAFYEITDRIDWARVPAILKAREGIAQDITKDPSAPTPAGLKDPAASSEVRLSPLQGQTSKIE